RFAHSSIWIFLLQSVAVDETLYDGFMNGCGIIIKRSAEIARAWIELARLVLIIRKLHKRMMLANGNRIWCWRNTADVITGCLSDKSKRYFEFGILRKVFCTRHVKCRTGFIQRIISLLLTAKLACYIVRILKIKISCINQYLILFFCGDGKAPQY